MSKMIKCKQCGSEISSDAKVCPNCGGKNKQPIYKKWWFYAIIVVVIIAIASAGGGSDSKTESSGKNNNTSLTVESSKSVEYTVYDVSELFDDLESNAMKAESKYNNQYVELTGKLSVIDSDGKYISLAPSNNEFSFNSVHCYLKNDTQREIVMEHSTDDIITVKGKIISVGEFLGFSLNIDEIK